MNWISDLFTPITENTMIAVGIIFGVLIFATALIHGLALTNKKKNFTELKQRVHSWWVILIIFHLSILFNRTSALFFWALVSFLALKEYFSLIPTRRADRRVLFWAYLAIPFQFYLIHINYYDLFTVLIPIYFFLFLPLRMILIGETKGFLIAVSSIYWGLMIAVYSISHLGALLTLDPAKNPEGGTAGLILFLVALTEFNDVAQYCWGKSFGKRKIVPTVSPNKTWEGFLGGVVTTTTLAYFTAPLLTPIVGWHAFWIGIIISVGGFFGDVIVSAIKRDLGVKDTGHWIPGHGGILDRIDSLTFTALIYFRFLHFFYYS